MLYRRELCNIENPEERKVLSSVLYFGTLPRGSDPYINYWYYKDHGTKEEFQNAEKGLTKFLDDKVKLVNDLIEKIEKSNGQIKELTGYIGFKSVFYPFTVKKN
ncbi:MAG: hypothetical protein NUV46_01290 [Nanoarchaeota archaeon]|nr:hypothetical protein [Nanoarchaeota archaeon]